MKRFVCLICLLTLLLSACSETEPLPTIPYESGTLGIYQLTFETRNISNASVGNDWSFTYTYDGQTIQNGYTFPFSLELFTFLPIYVEVRENDKIDDVGTAILPVAICDGGSGQTEVTVTETNGKFKGNRAVWEIICDVKLVGKE